MEIDKVGIGLGKSVFHLAGLSTTGETVLRRKFWRPQLLRFTANLRVRGRALREQGHGVRLMPAQYVKPYVKTNKNDYIDAEAIAEAVDRPRMRYVPIKSDDQLDMQSLHRVRERWVGRRTAVVNQIRGLLLEQLQCELRQLHSQIEEVDAAILKTAQEHEACQRLMGIPASDR